MAGHALVIEGGGMKAAYANGVLSAFEEGGHAPWDWVLGTSAGGALAAWYSAGQARFAEETWKYADDRRFLSYRRALLRKGPLLDHEALLDIVYQAEHPLDLDALARASWPVLVTVVEVASGECRYVDIRRDDPITWLKATGRLPFGSNGPVEVAGAQYLDGGTIDPMPARHAVEVLGADEVTVILNNPPGPRRPDPRLVLELASRRYPALRDGILRHQEIKAASYEYAIHPPTGIVTHVVRPSGPLGVGRFSRDVGRLRAVIEIGRRDGRRFLDGDHAGSDGAPFQDKMTDISHS
jgi:predicted patatin/cPLA2 family phospholipase